MPIIALACAVTPLVVFTFIWKYYHTTPANVPVSVNYHFTRRCNYQCGFCFHTAKTSYILPLEDAKNGLLFLKQAGTRKLCDGRNEICYFNLTQGRHFARVVSRGRQLLRFLAVQ